MFKQVIVLSSLLVGGGSAGMAMYLQSNPLAFSKSQRVNLETYLYSAKADVRVAEHAKKPVALVADAPPMIVDLPEVTVGPVRPVAAGLATPRTNDVPGVPETLPPPSDGTQPATTPRELHPCSKFREIGPMNVDDGVPTGTRGVRDLC